jgi:hypothetical protein
MLTGTKNTLRSYPSLLQLQTVLIAAESESPAQPPIVDVNEKLALQLIARMQANYKRELPFTHMHEAPSTTAPMNLYEMAGTHAQ